MFACDILCNIYAKQNSVSVCILSWSKKEISLILPQHMEPLYTVEFFYYFLFKYKGVSLGLEKCQYWKSRVRKYLVMRRAL